MNLKMLLYCTKVKGKNYYLRKLPNGRYCLSRDKGEVESLNGKIVAVHDYELEEVRYMIQYKYPLEKAWHVYLTPNLEPGELKERSCLTSSMLDKYKPCYAIHIKNLNVFDKPKELNAFYKSTNEFTFEPPLPLIKAPQNMCYAYDKYGNKYVVISVHPEWLCLILNGLKDVELRRKVLKEML